jgi:hypothetical protein
MAAVLAMSPEACRSFFEGRTPERGRNERGVTEIQGAASAEKIKADIHELDKLRGTKRCFALPYYLSEQRDRFSRPELGFLGGSAEPK